MPRFSLVLPTRQRSDVLGHCLATLIKQDFDDYEIIVQNNGRDPATEAVIHDFANDRVRHCYSDAILTTTENWEAGIRNARGDYVCVIGDGDAIFPDCCRIAADIVDRTGIELLTWPTWAYFWPGFIRPDYRNFLIATVNFELTARMIESEELLRRLHRFEGVMPPYIYHSFVHRSVIERAVSDNGRYILSSYPDFSSGLVNAAYVARFARVSRSLSVVGLSHHSSAGKIFFADQEASPEIVKKDFHPHPVDPRLIWINNVPIMIANELLLEPHQTLLSRYGMMEVDFVRLLERMASEINFRPAFYEQTLATIKALAERHSIDLGDILIPPRANLPQRLVSCAAPCGPHRVRYAIDGEAAGLRSSADVVTRLQQFIPSLYGAERVVINEHGGDRGMLHRGHAMGFGYSGDGVAALGDGWAPPESWGTWSVQKRAWLRLAIDPDVKEDIHLALTYRTLMPDVGISCRVQGQELAAWSFGSDKASGVQRITIPLHAVSARHAVDLEFLVTDLRSPAEHGLGSDVRTLGIGMESLELLNTGRSSWSHRVIRRAFAAVQR